MRAPLRQRRCMAGAAPTHPACLCRYGPFLRFNSYEPLSRQYRASVLLVVHQVWPHPAPTAPTCQPAPACTQAKAITQPVLRFRDSDAPNVEASIKALHLDHYQGWNFWCGVHRCGAPWPGG